MTCFNTRVEALASARVNAAALEDDSRHENQQALRHVWLDAARVKKIMWCGAGADDEELEPASASYASSLTMDMTEEEYGNLPRSNRLERRRAKAYDRQKTECAG